MVSRRWVTSLSRLREQRGWTQRELAEKVGFDEKAVRLWENRHAKPNADTQQRLAAIFNVPESELFGYIVSTYVPVKSLTAIQEEAITQVAEADPSDIQAIAAATQALISSYYQSGLHQSQRSFRWSLIWGGIGLAFLILVLLVLLLGQPTQIAVASGICAVLIEAFAAIFLYLYKHASDQLAAFRVGLEDTQRLLLANSMCEKLHGEQEQASRAEIIRLVVTSATTLKKPEHFFLPTEQKPPAEKEGLTHG